MTAVIVQFPRLNLERLRLALPRELWKVRAFLLWRAEDQGPGVKPLKVPYYASGRRRSGQQGTEADRNALVDFEEACRAFEAETANPYTGIGWASQIESKLIPLDFDNCVTNRVIDEKVQQLIAEIGSYTEISPSGNGVRILCYGTIGFGRALNPDTGKHIEILHGTGYVTLTGDNISGDTIEWLSPATEAKLQSWVQDARRHDHTRNDQARKAKEADPVYRVLAARNIILQDNPNGVIGIECPFADEHTGGNGPTSTVYLMPNTNFYTKGHFDCKHSHCSHRTDADFLAALGVRLPTIALLDRAAGESPIVDAATFIQGWTPTEYVLKGVLQRRFLHALTGHSNAGKTAISLKIAVCVATGKPFGKHTCTQNKVVYLAGENADDVRARVIALAQDMQLDLKDLAQWLFVLPHTFPLAEHVQLVADEIKKLGPVGLVVVDTRAAYGAAEDENDNTQALADALATRELTRLPGGPCVLVPNHPSHSALPPTMRPRGGSAYYGEIDINLNVSNDGMGTITLQSEKMRGAPFEPIQMELRQYTLAGYAQPDGDPIVSVVVDVLGDQDAESKLNEALSEQDTLMRAMQGIGPASVRSLADACAWKGGGMRTRVSRMLKSLANDKLVREYRAKWVLTAKGASELAQSAPKKARK